MSPTNSDSTSASAVAGDTGWVRVTHWVVAASVVALAVSGFTILVAPATTSTRVRGSRRSA